MRIAVRIEPHVARTLCLESDAVGAAFHANFVPEVIVRQRARGNRPRSRVAFAEQSTVPSNGGKADVAGRHERFVEDSRFGNDQLACAIALSIAQGACLPEASIILVASSEADRATIIAEQSCCHAGKLLGQIGGALLEMLDEVAEELVKTDIAQLFANDARWGVIRMGADRCAGVP